MSHIHVFFFIFIKLSNFICLDPTPDIPDHQATELGYSQELTEKAVRGPRKGRPRPEVPLPVRPNGSVPMTQWQRATPASATAGRNPVHQLNVMARIARERATRIPCHRTGRRLVKPLPDR